MAIPNKTHKNADVTLITLIKRSIPAIIPMMILATIDKPAQLVLQ